MAVGAIGFRRGVIGGALRRLPIDIGLCVLSFGVYTILALSLHQELYNPYTCERDSIAAAATNVIFGARPGVLDANLLDAYRKTAAEPLRQVLNDTQNAIPRFRAVESAASISVTGDGNGVGYLVFATLAFRLFGLHAWALPLLMLILMGCSTASFLIRFGRNFAGVVILYFGALTVMLFSPLVWDLNTAGQIPIGGIRYFTLTTVLPAFHILLEILERRTTQEKVGVRNSAFLAAQSGILVMAGLVRGNAVVLLGILAIIFLAMLWLNRGNGRRVRLLGRKAAICGIILVGLVAAVALALPSTYVLEGRFGTVVWHRITISLGMNPAFPFPGLTEMFNCKEHIPEGILPGTVDRNGHCIFIDYLLKNNIPVSDAGREVYGRRYEAIMRDSFFAILQQYPVEILSTFLYYKPKSIVSSMFYDFSFSPNAFALAYSSTDVGLLIITIVFTFGYFAWKRIPGATLQRISTVAVISLTWTIPPYFAAWAAPHTSADLLFYCIFLTGLAFIGIAVGARSLWTGAPSDAKHQDALS